MLIPNKEELNPASCRACAIEKKYPEFYLYLKTKYPKYKFPEKLALYYMGADEPPRCIVCGSPVKFINFKQGYRRTCSIKCQGKDPGVVNSRKQTMLLRYGQDNPGKVKAFQYKAKQTCLEKYGVENGGWSADAQQKIKKTNQERYGVDHPMQNQEIREKSHQTCMERYGYKYNMSNEDVKARARITNLLKYGGTGYASQKIIKKIQQTCGDKFGTIPVLNEDMTEILYHRSITTMRNLKAIHEAGVMAYTTNGNWVCKCPHPECNKCADKIYITPAGIRKTRLHNRAEVCTNLLPIQPNRTSGTTLELFIRNILDQHNIQYQTNVRDIIPPQELDIYIPSHKLAIECNGVYWHDTAHKGSAYHEQKTKDCAAAGIRLMHIWEDWVVNTHEIVESMLLNRLGLSPNKIYARKCEIRDVDSKTANNFLSKNHIQGRSMASVRMGLYYNDQLVSLMTFGKKRGCMGNAQNTIDGEWELVRFCSLLNTQVIGGASKLFKAFVRLYEPKIIYSFASQDISQGNVYKKLGFKCDGKVTGSYWYIDPIDLRRYHRSVFTKDAIIKMGWKDMKEGWTERQVMEEQGYIRIDDAGQTKWIYTA